MGKRRRSKSLTPLEIRQEVSLQRLEGPLKKTYRERVIAHLWALENTRRLETNFGRVPIDWITHTCHSGCRPQFDILGGDGHAYRAPDVETIKALSSLVQWLATNNGRAFLQEYQHVCRSMENLSDEAFEKAYRAFENRVIKKIQRR